MKAIVLTYGRNAAITRHMIRCYEEVWPDHPFTFRIPFQEELNQLRESSAENIQTPKAIKFTVLALLRDLDDEEWVYWCIDDKYPVKLNLPLVQSIYNSIVMNEFPSVSGILFCRARRMMDPEYLTGGKIQNRNILYLERKAYQQIWIHQFIRVKAIRYLFMNFPDDIPFPGIMDDLKQSIDKPAGHRLFVTSENHAVFGESTLAGRITGNCLNSMACKNIQVPEWFDSDPDVSVLIGELH